MTDSLLYYGENLDVLRKHIGDESVDLIYLDPPFNSNRAFNVLFEKGGHDDASAQIQAFDDTWRWDHIAAAAYAEVVESGNIEVSRLMQAFRGFLGEANMMAYVAMMAPRLMELHRVLKPTGSLYLHCDPTASHFLRLLLDSAFGPRNFRSQIIWKRSSAHSDTKQGRKQHGRIHDVILFYTKSDKWTWNPLYSRYDSAYVEQFYRYTEPETGRRYRLGDLTGPGGAKKGNPEYEVLGVTRYWRYSREKMTKLISQGRVVQTKPGGVPAYKRYLDEMPGVPLQDVWTDINPIASQATERLGYPTQKPLALLERIIRSSSNEGDVVLDSFCGCGTTIAAAEKLNRRWIGIDITHLAINLVRVRLKDSTTGTAKFQVIGEPVDVAGAEALAAENKYQFQWWALGLVGARPAHEKKGADKGIDGRLFFDETGKAKYKQVIIQVKGGKVGVSDVRDLVGVLQREKAEIGVIISFEEPTGAMRKEAATADFYTSPWGKHPRVQLLTVADLLDGRTIDYPATTGSNKTFKAAPKLKTTVSEQLRVFAG